MPIFLRYISMHIYTSTHKHIHSTHMNSQLHYMQAFDSKNIKREFTKSFDKKIIIHQVVRCVSKSKTSSQSTYQQMKCNCASKACKVLYRILQIAYQHQFCCCMNDVCNCYLNIVLTKNKQLIDDILLQFLRRCR
jgi:hypothetical protein